MCVYTCIYEMMAIYTPHMCMYTHTWAHTCSQEVCTVKSGTGSEPWGARRGWQGRGEAKGSVARAGHRAACGAGGGRGREERECEPKRLVQGDRAPSTAAEGGAGPGRDVSSEGWLLFYPPDDGQGP